MNRVRGGITNSKNEEPRRREGPTTDAKEMHLLFPLRVFLRDLRAFAALHRARQLYPRFALSQIRRILPQLSMAGFSTWSSLSRVAGEKFTAAVERSCP